MLRPCRMALSVAVRIRPLSAAERAIAGAAEDAFVLKHGGIEDVPMATVYEFNGPTLGPTSAPEEIYAATVGKLVSEIGGGGLVLVVGPPGGGKTHALLGDSCSSAPATHAGIVLCTASALLDVSRAKRLTARLTMSFVDVSRASEGEGLVVHDVLPAMLGGAEPFVACEIDDVLEVEVSSAEEAGQILAHGAAARQRARRCARAAAAEQSLCGVIILQRHGAKPLIFVDHESCHEHPLSVEQLVEALTGSVPEEGVSAMRESRGDERELAELLSSFSPPSVARAACERVVMLVSVSPSGQPSQRLPTVVRYFFSGGRCAMTRELTASLLCTRVRPQQRALALGSNLNRKQILLPKAETKPGLDASDKTRLRATHDAVRAECERLRAECDELRAQCGALSAKNHADARAAAVTLAEATAAAATAAAAAVRAELEHKSASAARRFADERRHLKSQSEAGHSLARAAVIRVKVRALATRDDFIPLPLTHASGAFRRKSSRKRSTWRARVRRCGTTVTR